MSTTMALTSSAGQHRTAASGTLLRGNDQCCISAQSPVLAKCSVVSSRWRRQSRCFLRLLEQALEEDIMSRYQSSHDLQASRPKVEREQARKGSQCGSRDQRCSVFGRVVPPPYMARLSGRHTSWCRHKRVRPTALQHRCAQ